MNPTLRKIIAVAVGVFVGMMINGAIVNLGHTFFPIEGLEKDNLESLKKMIPFLESKHFIFPFLGHALGTLIGALITGLIVSKDKMRIVMISGGIFLVFGILVNIMLPGAPRFSAIDIIFAYIPMAWIGGKIAIKLSKK